MTEGIRNNLMDAGCPEDSAALVEQFYSTGHVETVVLMSKVKE